MLAPNRSFSIRLDLVACVLACGCWRPRRGTLTLRKCARAWCVRSRAAQVAQTRNVENDLRLMYKKNTRELPAQSHAQRSAHCARRSLWRVRRQPPPPAARRPARCTRAGRRARCNVAQHARARYHPRFRCGGNRRTARCAARRAHPGSGGGSGVGCGGRSWRRSTSWRSTRSGTSARGRGRRGWRAWCAASAWSARRHHLQMGPSMPAPRACSDPSKSGIACDVEMESGTVISPGNAAGQ